MWISSEGVMIPQRYIENFISSQPVTLTIRREERKRQERYAMTSFCFKIPGGRELRKRAADICSKSVCCRLNRDDSGWPTMILPLSHSPLGRGSRNEGGFQRTWERLEAYDVCQQQTGRLTALSGLSGQASGSSVE